MRKFVLATAAAILGIAALALPSPAHAYYFYGPRVVVGFPFFVPPPVYVAPPVVYAPRPVYVAPAPAYTSARCYAGAYVCPLDHPTPVGAGCSCPTNGGRAYGDAR
jgi:hypothetical protein